MGFITKLAAFAIRQTLPDSAAKFVEKLGQYYTDPTHALPNAVNQANAQTWQLIELAIAGDSLRDKAQRLLISGQMRGILTPLRERVQQLGPTFCSDCLQELRAARDAGLLAVGTGQELLAVSQGVRIVTDPVALLTGARQIVTQAGGELASYPHLAQVLTAQNDGETLLVTAFGYFLRQEINKQPKLRDELQLSLLNQLAQEQAAGWDGLYRLLSEQGGEIAAELATLSTGMAGLAQGQAVIEGLVREALNRLPKSAQHGAVPPHLSSILRSAADLQLFAELTRRVNACPLGERTPELLDAVGRLAMAVGVFDQAGERFQQAATAASLTGATATQAEELYNRYRALLEQRHWGDALQAILEAARLDPARFAPFPLRRYPPQQILGAGGFGVAFLCHDTHLGVDVVIKTLYSEELERNITEVFREGRILRGLRHPAIIEMINADYADPDERRPYLVMEHFSGISLGDYLTQHGCLTLEQTLALAHPIAEALKVAHDQGVWHRDLKPDNLLVRMESSGTWAIKLIDFGFATRNRVVQSTVAAGTAANSLVGASCGGTYQFSAPEQLGLVIGKIGPWSDVYAFGKTLCFAKFKTTQPTPRNYRELVNHPFVDLLSDCLEQEIELRPQDFGQVLSRLDTGDEGRLKQEEEERQRQEIEARQRREAEERQRKEAETKQKRETEEQQRQEVEAKQRQEAEDQQRQKAEAKRLAEQKNLISNRYKDNGDGTVTNTTTGLMWKRCSEGQTWDGNTCVGDVSESTWDAAMPNGKQKSWPAFAGHRDWRLPTKDELSTLIVKGSYPTIDMAVFPNTPSGLFWTSSADASDSSYSWIVHFGGGCAPSGYLNSAPCAVRLARGGQ